MISRLHPEDALIYSLISSKNFENQSSGLEISTILFLIFIRYNLNQMEKRITIGFFCLLLVVVVGLISLVIPTLNAVVFAAPDAQLTPFPTPTPGADGRIIYIVKTGDSLWRISAVSGIPMEELRALNNLGTNDVIAPGQELLLGLGGPASSAPTVGPPPTPTSALPTPTPGTGTGTLCVLLFEDINGDSIREEAEPSLPDGAISINKRAGNVSITADTPSGGISENLFPEPEELGFVCFETLEKGEYNVTVASPEGYNATTPLNYVVSLYPGEEIMLDFGAQPNSEVLARNTAPLGSQQNPVFGLIGGILVLVGAGFGTYLWIFHRK